MFVLLNRRISGEVSMEPLNLTVKVRSNMVKGS